ncbi:MAG: aldehyde ferredoxin oxidoreductase family protein [Alphaproteobacteria bacterium]|nr:aldehyde ferredoxin oxidoreductase family protein [Alphaproteobacteria bacterium]
MTKPFAIGGGILRVDLTRNEVTIDPTAPLNERFPAGMGVNNWLLLDGTPVGKEPLDPENPLIFTTGTLVGTPTPTACRMTISCKNVMTGGFGSASAGGNFGPELKYAGFDHIVVTGRAERPVFIDIVDGDVNIVDAADLWGQTTWETEKRLRAKLDRQTLELLSIGPAGENVAASACIMVNRTRAAARCGVGAVMGSKNLKAIAVSGSGSLEVADPQGFMDACLDMQRHLMGNETRKNLRNFGTPASFGGWNDKGSIPVRNFQETQIDAEGANAISTAVKEKRYIKKAFGCFSCPVLCSQYQQVKEGPYAGTRGEKIESQNYWDFGGKLGISDPAAVLALSELCARLGLDNTNATNPIAWAFECFQRGLLSADDADGLNLEWGDVDVVLELLRKIAYREGIGDLLADGSFAAAKKLGRGSERFAIHMKGQDLAEEMRVFKGWALAIAVAERGGTHTQGGPLTERMGLEPELSMERFGVPTAFDSANYEHKADLVVYYQRFHNLLEITGICFYATYWSGLYTMGPEDVARLYGLATGETKTAEELMMEGEKVLYLQKAFNMRHTAFDRESDYPPERMMSEPATGPHAGERLDRADWDRLLDQYYGLRGWDLASGKPTAENFRAVGLPELV